MTGPETHAHTYTMDEKVIELGVDFQCKYMIFMPELFRHTSQIYLASLAGVSMLQGRPQSFKNTGLRSVKRRVRVCQVRATHSRNIAQAF